MGVPADWAIRWVYGQIKEMAAWGHAAGAALQRLLEGRPASCDSLSDDLIARVYTLRDTEKEVTVSRKNLETVEEGTGFDLVPQYVWEEGDDPDSHDCFRRCSEGRHRRIGHRKVPRAFTPEEEKKLAESRDRVSRAEAEYEAAWGSGLRPVPRSGWPEYDGDVLPGHRLREGPWTITIDGWQPVEFNSSDTKKPGEVFLRMLRDTPEEKERRNNVAEWRREILNATNIYCPHVWVDSSESAYVLGGKVSKLGPVEVSPFAGETICDGPFCHGDSKYRRWVPVFVGRESVMSDYSAAGNLMNEVRLLVPKGLSSGVYAVDEDEDGQYFIPVVYHDRDGKEVLPDRSVYRKYRATDKAEEVGDSTPADLENVDLSQLFGGSARVKK